jgi:hypothetical protein
MTTRLQKQRITSPKTMIKICAFTPRRYSIPTLSEEVSFYFALFLCEE